MADCKFRFGSDTKIDPKSLMASGENIPLGNMRSLSVAQAFTVMSAAEFESENFKP
jgi:hypothetical protein